MVNEKHEDYQYNRCISRGICSINPATASLQEVILLYLKYASFYGLKLEECGIKDKRLKNFILNTIAVLSSNYEISEANFGMINSTFQTELPKSIKYYNEACGGTEKPDINLPGEQTELNEYIRFGEKEFNKKLQNIENDERNLYRILFILIKSICINILVYESYEHSADEEILSVYKVLNLINTQEKSKDELKKLILDFAEKDSNLTLVAVSRYGERINKSPRQVVLQAGDTLLLLCPKNVNIDTTSPRSDIRFFESDDVPNVGTGTIISSIIMIAMVALSALGVMPLLQCAFLAAGAMLICRCCNTEQAMKAINWDILMVFAGSAVLGLAIQKTGIAAWLANGILDVCGTNPLVVMTAVCLVGTFITEFISNTAAGAMFFPIMYEAAEKMGYDPFPFLVALMISVSSSFATPIGSPTHMLVYGPGGYRFSDFMRIGLLMNLIILAANILIVNIIYPLTPLP